MDFGKFKFVSIFIGYILVKTKTLYVMVAGQSVFKLESSYIETFTVHKLLEDTHEVSIAKTKTNQPVPVQPSGLRTGL
jgi:hypothetical protein